MWGRGWRDTLWATLDGAWDLIVIGGGVTGAGILRLAAGAGLRVLLLEQRDFGWGTSGRSSKMVHGGLRYLAHGQLRLTRDASMERERLLREAPGLIERLPMLIPLYRGQRPGRWSYLAALMLYDLLGGRPTRRYLDPSAVLARAPDIARESLQGGYAYDDAVTDDSRLVLRLIRDGVRAGGHALNHARVTGLIRHAGRVAGVQVADGRSERTHEIQATAVVNATGPWADRLRARLGASQIMRPLRGSHLIFPAWRVPLAQAVVFRHPQDQRALYVYPWEGVTIVGTTDLDDVAPDAHAPVIRPAEVDYLLAGSAAILPDLALGRSDVQATFAGVRPVVARGSSAPSDASRESVIVDEEGLLTVTGGKLTTFRPLAVEALTALAPRLPALAAVTGRQPLFATQAHPLPALPDPGAARRITGRFGAESSAVVAAAAPGELERIPGTRTLWAEVRWAARAEGICTLEDLMLRRLRLGLLLPGGGESILPRIGTICREELGWNGARWQGERTAYLAHWRRAHGAPGAPDGG